MVPAVGDENISVRCHGDSQRRIELRAARCAVGISSAPTFSRAASSARRCFSAFASINWSDEWIGRLIDGVNSKNPVWQGRFNNSANSF
jgi:hypothetical protein